MKRIASQVNYESCFKNTPTYKTQSGATISDLHLRSSPFSDRNFLQYPWWQWLQQQLNGSEMISLAYWSCFPSAPRHFFNRLRERICTMRSAINRMKCQFSMTFSVGSGMSTGNAANGAWRRRRAESLCRALYIVWNEAHVKIWLKIYGELE